MGREGSPYQMDRWSDLANAQNSPYLGCTRTPAALPKPLPWCDAMTIVCYDSEVDARAAMDGGEYGRAAARFADVPEGPPTPRGYGALYHTAPDAPTG